MVRFNDHLGTRLGPLVDGEMAHGERDRALAHLANCAPCRTLVEAERRLKSQLGALPMPEPSARLMAALFQMPQTHGAGHPQPPDDDCLPPGPSSGSTLGGVLRSRSAAFFPEFAVGLRPLGDRLGPPPEQRSDPHTAQRVVSGSKLSGVASVF
ncbi:MAG TPA: zf-HC2 domain-containing protein [Actinocrinis sp.]|nr:zf-HC2 domain-containing protein [Actinocrinis sp.]